MNDTNFDSNADVQLKEITNFNELKKCLDIILKTYKDRDEKLNLSKENNMRHSAMTFEQLKEMYDCGIKMYGYFKTGRKAGGSYSNKL